jgi:hypothetical protein
MKIRLQLKNYNSWKYKILIIYNKKLIHLLYIIYNNL